MIAALQDLRLPDPSQIQHSRHKKGELSSPPLESENEHGSGCESEINNQVVMIAIATAKHVLEANLVGREVLEVIVTIGIGSSEAIKSVTGICDRSH